MKSCDHWGSLDAPKTRKPGCQCAMCLARDYDTLQPRNDQRLADLRRRIHQAIHS
jgi:hypothetical protein